MSDKRLPRVVKVIDEYTLVLNRGERDGIALGDKFLVYGLGEEITDPETEENLGAIEARQGRVKVVHTQEKLSTARTATTVKVPGRKRRIERSNPFSLAALGKGVEEIEEDHSYEDEPLEGPEIGDFARPT